MRASFVTLDFQVSDFPFSQLNAIMHSWFPYFSPPMVGDSRRLALRIHVPDADVTKALVFDALMTVGQACDQIRHQIREIDGLDNRKRIYDMP